MRGSRSLGALCGTVAVHAGFVVWIGGLAWPARDADLAWLEPPETLIDVVWLDGATLAPDASREGRAIPHPRAPTASSVPDGSVRPVTPPPRPSPQADPAPISPPDAPADAEVESAVVAPDAGAVPEPPEAPAANPTPDLHDLPDGRGPARMAGAAPTAGDAARDHSAYGAAIARIVDQEIRGDPVGGMRVTDQVDVELRVLPNGRLARVGDGRFGYAQIVRSSVGPLRMRALLRRIWRASQRFPRHPKGYPRRPYVIGVKLRFTRGEG